MQQFHKSKQQQQEEETFLFSTNNAAGMQLNNLPEEEKINETKWNTLKFPENCKMIKKIICGAEFAVILNELNDFYYFGSLKNSVSNFWNKLKIESKDLKIKNIFSNYSDLIIQLNNDDLMICRRNVTKPAVTKIFNECGIKSIFCGPLTRNFIVVDKKNKVYEMTSKFEQKEIDTSELYNSTSIKIIGCSNLAYLLVTSDNKIYGYGSNFFGELGSLQSTLNKFQYMSTPFEKESEIIDVKGGFYHFVVLLKSGIVFAIGHNTLGAVNVYNQNNFNHFIKLTHPLFENEFINRIQCSSRGTVLITKNNNAYFIGEVVFALQGYDCNNDDNNRIDNCDSSVDELSIESYKSKSLLYFEKKLSNVIKELHYNDISIITVC
ncbi:hypothetical protein ABK040_008545 [Willaertia magna]